MLRRFYATELAGRCLGIYACRHVGTTCATSETIEQLISTHERDQCKMEMAVDSRSVVFACAASADHRPRIAAVEAFDVAAAALPQPPNFCFLNVSLDYAGMLDAPEVVWYNFCKANDVTPSSVRPQQLHMVGGATRHQRPGGGYIQVMLGCIPDLESDVFTFDAIPEVDDLNEPNRPPPVMCFALLDNKLALQYEHVLSVHLQLLGERLGKAPLVGGVFPSVEKPTGAGGGSNGDNINDEERGRKRSMSDDSVTSAIGNSIFFVNERVYTGSAAGLVLRSAMTSGHHVNVVPSISVGTVTVTSVSFAHDVFSITTLDNKRATDVIRDFYCSGELRGKTSKVFLGIRHREVCVPLSFIGHPDTGILQFTAPRDVEVKPGDQIELVVDDAELDSETGAGLLIGLQRRLSIAHVAKDVCIAREARKSVVASSVAAFHFSHGGMNAVARPEVNVTLGNSPILYAPSVLQRCLGKTCPTSGVFCPGQVLMLGDVTGMFARSSSYGVLEGLK